MAALVIEREESPIKDDHLSGASGRLSGEEARVVHPTSLTLKGEVETPRCVERIDREAPAAGVMRAISLREGWLRLWREGISRVDGLSVCSPETPLSEGNLVTRSLCSLEIEHAPLLFSSIFSAQRERTETPPGRRRRLCLTLLAPLSARGAARLHRGWGWAARSRAFSLSRLGTREGDPERNKEQGRDLAPQRGKRSHKNLDS